MFLRVGVGQTGEADILENAIQQFQRVCVGIRGRSQNHGGACIQAVGGGGEAVQFPACHGVPAHIGESAILCDGSDGVHHNALDTAQIHQNGGTGNQMGVVPDPLDSIAGTDGHQNQITFRQVFVRQGGIDGTAHTGHIHGLGFQINAPDGVGGAEMNALGHGAADEAQADNADFHKSVLQRFGDGMQFQQLLRRSGEPFGTQRLGSITEGMGRAMMTIVGVLSSVK